MTEETILAEEASAPPLPEAPPNSEAADAETPEARAPNGEAAEAEQKSKKKD